MRQLERAILLQMIDNRWREHLAEMDYLREGIHLRGFAQIDPLVAYKNEGFSMFEVLMNSIWEEFARLIFHVEVEVAPRAQEEFAPTRAPRPGWSTQAAPPSSPRRSAQAAVATSAGPDAAAEQAIEGTARRPGNGAPSVARSRRRSSRTSARRSAATTPAGAARARSTRSATAPSAAAG